MPIVCLPSRCLGNLSLESSVFWCGRQSFYVKMVKRNGCWECKVSVVIFMRDFSVFKKSIFPNLKHLSSVQSKFFDEFLGVYFNNSNNFFPCRLFVKLLCLTHGQSSVEWCFSLNKQLLTGNISKVSFTGQLNFYNNPLLLGEKIIDCTVQSDLFYSCSCHVYSCFGEK